MARGVTANTLRALRHRNFQLFFGGQVISLTGTWMDSVAQAWLIYRLTGSSVLLGLVSFANQIPVFLISPLGGYVADRWNRHRIIIFTQAASMVLALALAWLTLSGKIQIWQLFVLAALLSVVNAFDIPARQSFLVEMVGRDDLINAIALNSSMFNGARMVGPAVAGLLVAKIGEGWCFFANGISYVAVITGLLMMKVGPGFQRNVPLSAWANIRDGFRYVAHTGPIRALLVMLAILSFAGLPFTVLMPVFADGILHGGPRAFGMLMGFVGLGAMCGALLLASRSDVSGLSRWLAAASVVFSIMLAGFAFSRSVRLSCALLLVAGFSMMIQVGATNTLIQSMVPDHYRGRVMSAYSMMLIGMSPVGAMAAGFEAEHIGAPLTIGIGAAVCLISAILFATRLPAFRRSARELLLLAQAG
ncbi:MAG TPA: MFS transporter [Bryobacteraceae bacterium]|nr:MFS transporter [Bryobacteraceae bacterium]